MGLYSNNRTMLGDVEIPALEGYNGNVGIATAMLEATKDDLKFFDMIIARDFQEAEMNLSGSVNESEMSYITEGALGDAWKRIVEFFKKMLAKVKAIFSSVMAKINGVIIRDNKKLVEKYRKAVLAKDLKDMKYKWAKSTNKSISTSEITRLYGEYATAISKCDSVENVNSWAEKNEDDILDEFYSASLGGQKVEAANYSKEAHEYLYEDAEEEDTGAASKISEVMSYLMTCKKSITELERKHRDAEKDISQIIKNTEREATEAAKNVPEKDGTVSNDAKVRLARANAVNRLATKYQTATLAAHREIINAMKFEVAQNRAFFTKAAAYNPKAKNENALLFDAIDEAVEFDVETSFADYVVE